MLGALLTLLCWSISPVVSRLAVLRLGAVRANLWRLVLASLLLWGLAVWVGSNWWGPGLLWFLVSGAVGLGLGDIALFAGYRLIGTRLTVLLTYCLSVLLAGVLEWLCRGVDLTRIEILGCLTILIGTSLAILPGLPLQQDRRLLRRGLLAGVLSALGLAVGAVLARQGFQVQGDLAGHGPWDGFRAGLGAGFVRNLGGLIVLLAVQALVWWRAASAAQSPDWRRGLLWLGLTSLVGPGLGVVCWQWALQTEKAAVVQAVLALLPATVMPLAWWWEGDRPRLLAGLGSLLAVAGAVGMALAKA